VVVRSELCICIPAVRCEPSFSDLRFGSSRELLAVRSELPAQFVLVVRSELPVVRFGSSRELPVIRSELLVVRSELPENPGTTKNPGPNCFGTSILVVHCELPVCIVHTNYILTT
jgi:hypothetical protein